MLKLPAAFCFDAETTGLEKPIPVELGATITVQGKTQVLMNTRCKPGKEIHPESSEIHGIYEADLKFYPTAKLALGNLITVLEEYSEVLDIATVGYNSAKFDGPMLVKMNPGFEVFMACHIDVYALVLRHLTHHGTKLITVYESYIGKEATDGHAAAYDCLMTMEILHKYMEETNKSYMQIVEELAIPMPYEIFPFGKHQGVPTSKVPRPYIRYARNNWTDVSADMKATFKYALQGG